MQTEIWKDIENYEGTYQISNFGHVKSLPHEIGHRYVGQTRTTHGKIMSPTDNGNGYKIVGLKHGGKRKNFYIHRLVAAAFIDNPDNKNYVNHIDFNKANNNSCNLEWCTQKENIAFSRLHMCKPKNVVKSKTHQKYIYLRKNKFRVAIPNIFDRCYTTLDEAIQARDSVLFERRHSEQEEV